MVNYKEVLRALTHSITNPDYGPDISVQRAFLDVAVAIEKAVEAGVGQPALAGRSTGGRRRSRCRQSARLPRRCR